MKVSREQAAQNRARVVDVAAKLFRERGYGGIGVADLMKAAGLTHGGFYGNFASKEDLMAEACTQAVNDSLAVWEARAASNPQAPLQSISAAYLSPEHRDAPGTGCAVAALGPELARLGAPARLALTDGVRAQIAKIEGLLPDGTESERRQAAQAMLASMVGAIVLARAVNDTDLSDEILEAVKAAL
jgi:TetR/AcrR family transcriptional repressor of nem operon